MTGKERVALAMRGRKADRTPLMCQVSYGFMAAHVVRDPLRFWYAPEGLAEAFVETADRYRFDGILVNKAAAAPGKLDELVSLEPLPSGEKLATWRGGRRTRILPDTDPVDLDGAPEDRRPVSIDDLDVDAIPAVSEEDRPDWSCNVLKAVLRARGETLSVHGEIVSNFSSFLYSFRSTEYGLMALLDDPDKAKAAIERLNRNSIFEAREQCRLGIDALKISCAWAGAGLISREMYEEFVLPTKQELIDAVHREFGIPVYIHTCGAIGDRLDLLAATGADGLECLDPPPIGTCDLRQASRILGGRMFINIVASETRDFSHAEETPPSFLELVL